MTTKKVPDWIILTLACIAQFMVVLDVSIVNVALPSMKHSLHLTASGSEWVVNAYVLTFAGFLLLGGRAADLFGRRKVYLTGIAIFVLASIGAGLAANQSQIIAVRALQGIGGAILSPATLTIIITTFQGARLPKAIGAWSAVAGAGGAVGGLLGGILTGVISWRWVFFINVPFGAAAVVGAILYLKELRNKDALVKLDIFGAVAVTTSLAAIIYGVVESPAVGWGSNQTISWLCGGAVGLAIFVFWELKVASHPLVPFRIFKSRTILGADLVMFCMGGAFFCMWYFLTFYFQGVHGYGPVRAGFAFLPMALSIIAGAQISSRIVAKTGIRPLLFVGTIMATIGFFWMSRLTVHGGYATDVLGPSIACSLAMGLLFTPLAAAATMGVDRADSGLASGALNAGRQIGGSLALAILATIVIEKAHTFGAAWQGPVAQVAGYQRAFEISSGITLVAFALTFLVPASAGRQAVTA